LIDTRQKRGKRMNIEDMRLAVSPHYLLMIKLYVCPDGSLLVSMGNKRLSVSPDEVHALIMGTIDYARVFSQLHDQLDLTALAILNENNKREG
jgi:hypothetical protein